MKRRAFIQTAIAVGVAGCTAKKYPVPDPAPSEHKGIDALEVGMPTIRKDGSIESIESGKGPIRVGGFAKTLQPGLKQYAESVYKDYDPITPKFVKFQ